MCGLVTIVGEIGPQEREMFDMMMYFNKVRGEHSTGVLTVDPISGETTVVKDVLTPEMMSYDQDWTDAVKKDSGLLMGHCRWATINKNNLTRDTAHPFEFNSLVGMHNGTLNPGYEEHLEQKGYGVDSETFFAAMQERGAEWALERAHGAYAFMWYDKNEHTLNIFKNEKRDLTYIQTKDKKTTFFISDPLFFVLASRYTRYSKQMDESSSFSGCFHVPENKIITIDVPDRLKQGHGKTRVKEFASAGTRYKAYPHAGRGSFRGKDTTPRLVGPVSQLPKLTHDVGSPVMEAPKNVPDVSDKEHEKIEKAFRNLDRRLSNRSSSPDYWSHIVNQVSNNKLERSFIVNEINKKEAQLETYKDKIQKGLLTRKKDFIQYMGLVESYEHRKDQLRTFDDLFPESDNLGIKKPFRYFNHSEWKNFLRHTSCTNCSMQDINWEQDECSELVTGGYLCPDCTNDAYVQSLIEEGTLRLA